MATKNEFFKITCRYLCTDYSREICSVNLDETQDVKESGVRMIGSTIYLKPQLGIKCLKLLGSRASPPTLKLKAVTVSSLIIGMDLKIKKFLLISGSNIKIEFRDTNYIDVFNLYNFDNGCLLEFQTQMRFGMDFYQIPGNARFEEYSCEKGITISSTPTQENHCTEVTCLFADNISQNFPRNELPLGPELNFSQE